MSENGVIPVDQIESIIFLIRGQKVMLSPHLAELYNVEPRVLVQAVKRNIDRFPRDFMFQLSDDEFFKLKSQIVQVGVALAKQNPMLLPNKELQCFQLS